MEPGKDICLPVIILTEDNSCESNDEGPGCEPPEEEDLCCDCDGGNATQNNSNQNNMSSSDVVCDNFAPYVGPNSLSGITAASEGPPAPTMGCYRYHPNHQFKPLCKVGGNRELLDIAENFEGGSLGIPEWARLNKMNTQTGSSDEREDEGRGQLNINNAAGSSSATAMAATCSKSSALPQEEENSNNEEMDVDDGENVPAKKPRAKAADVSKVKKSRGQRQVKKVPKSARKCAKKAQKKADDGAKCLRKRSYSKSFPGGVEDRDDDDDDDNDVLYSLAEEHRPREMLQQRGKVHNYNCNSNNNSNKKKAKSRTKKKKVMRRSRRSVNVNSNCNKCLRKKAQARCRLQRTMLDGSRRYCSSLANKQRCSRSRGKEPARRGRSTRSKSRRVCKPSIASDPQNVQSAHGNGNENVNNSNNNNNNVDDDNDNSFFRRLFFAKKQNSDTEADDASIRTLKSNDSCCNLNDDSANNNNNSNKIKSKAPKSHSRVKLSRKPKASSRRKLSKTGKSARAKKLLLEKYSKVKDTKGLRMKSLVHAKFMIPNKSNLEPLNLPPNYGMVVEEKTTSKTPKRGAKNRSAKRTSTRRRPRASAKKSRASSLKSRARSGFGVRKSRSSSSSKKSQKSRAKSRSKKSKYNLRTISKSKNLNNSDSNSAKNTLEVKSRNEKRNDGDSGKDPASGFMTIPMASGNIVKMKKCLPGKKGKASNRNLQVLKSNSRKVHEGETLEMKRSTREEGEHSSFTTIGKTTDLSGRGKRSLKKNCQRTGHEGSLTSGSNTNVNSNHQERSGSLGEPTTHRSRSPPKRQNNRRRCRPGRGKGGKASSRVRFRKKKVVHCYNRGK